MSQETVLANTIAMEIIESGVKIPTLPDSARQLMSISRQPVDTVDIKELELLVQKDPVLFAQILNLANSPYFRGRRDIVGLRSAIVRVGLQETLSHLTMYLLKNSLPKFPDIKGVSDKEHWNRSWACAVINRRLGDPKFHVESLPGELYLAGLMHGIGKLILAVYSPKDFYECIKTARDQNIPIEEAELEILGTRDSLIAQKILELWNLPQNVCAAVGFHTSPESAPADYLEIAAITQFASVITEIITSTCTTSTNGRFLQCCLTTIAEKTYITRNRYTKLCEISEQNKIIRESIALHNNLAAMQSDQPRTKTTQQDDESEANINRVTPDKITKGAPAHAPSKKGILGFICSLFAR